MPVFGIYYFFYVDPPKEDIFLTTFYGLYFSLSYTITYYELTAGASEAASMYCSASCPCDMWAHYYSYS